MRYLCQFVKSYGSETLVIFFMLTKSSCVTNLIQQNTLCYYNLLHLWNQYKLYLKKSNPYSSAYISLPTVRGVPNTNILTKRHSIKPFPEQTTQTCSELLILKPTTLCSLNYPPAKYHLKTEIRLDTFSKILICKCKGRKKGTAGLSALTVIIHKITGRTTHTKYPMYFIVFIINRFE